VGHIFDFLRQSEVYPAHDVVGVKEPKSCRGEGSNQAERGIPQKS